MLELVLKSLIVVGAIASFLVTDGEERIRLEQLFYLGLPRRLEFLIGSSSIEQLRLERA